MGDVGFMKEGLCKLQYLCFGFCKTSWYNRLCRRVVVMLDYTVGIILLFVEYQEIIYLLENRRS